MSYLTSERYKDLKQYPKMLINRAEDMLRAKTPQDVAG